MAGLTVGIVALPLALAFGVSSGAGAAAGLITAIVAGVVAAVFGGSHVQVSGPTGAMVVVLGPIVATHGAAAIALVSIMAGLVVLLVGLLKLGRTVSSIPWPVIEGFTLGIAVIIFLQQVPSAVGVASPHGENAVLAAVVPLPHSGALHSRPMKTCATNLPSSVNTCTRLPPRSETYTSPSFETRAACTG